MKQWVDSEITMLKSMYEQKKSVSIVAKIINRSVGSVRNKAYELGITHPINYSEEERNYILTNYKSYNLSDIAKKLNRPHTNICRFIREQGIDRPSKRKNDLETHIKRSEQSKKIIRENGHPRGMMGKSHTQEIRAIISERSREYWKKVTPEQLEARRRKMIATKLKNDTLNPNKTMGNPYSRTKSGKRADLNNVFFRSAWEANIARYYNYVGIKWEFEPKEFIFPDIRKGCVSYTPDFYLPEENRWVEVKGWMDKKSITKLKRFKKYYPKEYEKLEIIGANEYKAFKEYSRIIPNWED